MATYTDLVSILETQSGPAFDLHPHYTIVIDIRDIDNPREIATAVHYTLKGTIQKFHFNTPEEATDFCKFIATAKNHYVDSIKPSANIQYYISTQLDSIAATLKATIDQNFAELSTRITALETRTADAHKRLHNDLIDHANASMSTLRTSVEASVSDMLEDIPATISRISHNLASIHDFFRTVDKPPFDTYWTDDSL